MAKESRESAIERIQRGLKCSPEEAAEVYEADRAIDKLPDSEVRDDLTAEQKQVIKKMTSTGTRKPTVYKFNQPKRKANEPKRALIENIVEMLNSVADSNTIEVINVEREVTFKYDGTKYKIVLSAPRK